MNFIILDKIVGGGKGTIGVGLAGEATETWIILADGPDYSTEAVRNSGIFPPVYQSYHEQNSRLLLRPIEITQSEENPCLFTCVLKWESQPLTQKEKDEEVDDPLNRPARVKIKTIKEKEVKHRDKYGRPKLNAAGDLFDPPIESSTAYLQVIVRKNVADLPDWVFDFIDCVNTEDFEIEGRTFEAFSCCIADIDLGEKQNDGDVEYREAVVEIHKKKPRLPAAGEDPDTVPGPWQTEQLNEGLHELVDDPTTETLTKKRQRIVISAVDDEGKKTKQSAASPVLLDDTGARLSPVTIDNATYIIFDDHEYKNFNDISFIWAGA
jgi:hypothetical protein